MATNVASEDLYYDEYLRRRNAKLDDRRAKSEFPKAPTPPPKSSPKETERPRREESYGYVPEGYIQKNAYIGEDPLSSLRTMKANLRRKQIDSARQGFEVKAQLCQAACEELAKAEEKLVELHSLRSKAIYGGELEEAARIAAKMREVKNSAMHGSYTDLLMDSTQLEAFGVESKWTPETAKELAEERRFEEAQKNAGRDEDVPLREVRSFSARRRERVGYKKPAKKVEDTRHPSSKRKEERPPSTTRPKSTQRAPTPQREVKRNRRLSEYGKEEGERPKQRPKENDPFGLPVDYGECKFCGEEGRELGRESLLKLHYAERCPVVHICTFCDRAIEVAQLTDHQLNRCDFAKDALIRCALCGLAKDRHDDDHPLCRKQMPPSGAKWCPLCSVAVTDWRKHLKKDCYNNPRKGLSGVPLSASSTALNFMESVDKLTQKVAKFALANGKRNPSRNPSNLPSGRASAAPRSRASTVPNRSKTPMSPKSPSPPRRAETPAKTESPKPPPRPKNQLTAEQIREAYRKVVDQQEKERKEKEDIKG